MSASTPWVMLKETASDWLEDRVPRMGAALAYYSVFSLAPLLLIAVAVAGMVFGEQAARRELHQQLAEAVGPATAAAAEDVLGESHRSGRDVLGCVIGLAVLLFGASGFFVELQDVLNTIWKVKPRAGRGVWGVVRGRLVSFLIVAGAGLLLLVSVAVSTALSGLEQALGAGVPGGGGLWRVVSLALSFGLETLVFMMIYKVLPDTSVGWRDVWVGAVITALLFNVGKYLIGLYLARGAVASAFGAAGSVIVVLVWVYYSSQIVLFGAEFTRVYARHAGSDIRPAENAVPLTAEERARRGMVSAADEETAARARPAPSDGQR
jgi:membrane protein